MRKLKTSISIDEELYEKLKEIADKEDRSFSQQISNIIKDFLKEKGE